MMKNLILGILVIILFACSKDDDTPEKSSDCFSGTLSSVECSGNVLPDTVNGFTITYYSGSTQKQEEGNYLKGIPDGFFKKYAADGSSEYEGNYTSGKRNGFWKVFYSNGLVKFEGTYTNCIKTGFWKYYHSTGSVSSEGTMRNDNRIGVWQFYDATGKLLERVEYDC